MKTMIDNKYPESELTGKIIGCAMEVHRILGNGFTHLFYFIFKGIREYFAFQEVIYPQQKNLLVLCLFKRTRNADIL